MKITIKYILTLSICFFTIISCKNKDQSKKPQQEIRHNTPPKLSTEQVKKMMEDLRETLQLNNKQTSSISKLYIAHFKDINNFEINPDNLKEITREEMEKRKNSFEKEVKSFLNNDQIKQYEVYLDENNPHKMDNRQRPQH